ncbi:transglycosylase SLT domain-containing protein [Chelativorans xinjiangense]|uniref:lytic transglycosylase domain-containing protein n=1 Tax=Chelativorans xinjiangense TaxID=2681485 RepID=UPI003CCD41FA
MKTKAALTALALGLSVSGVGAQTESLPGEAPLPTPRPYAPLGKAAMAASLPFAAGILNPQGDLALLKEGLQALSKGDVPAARGARETLKEGSLDHAILGWAIALSNAEGVRSREIVETVKALSGWPGMARLHANSERALYRENLPASDVIAAFAGKRPATFEGTMALARAHAALGNRGAALAVLSPFWRSEKLEPKEEAALLKEFGGLIPAADHRHRMERMLYDDRVRSAERVAKLAGGEALTRAWAAVIRNQREAGKLLDAVPEGERTAGYVFAKARHLRRTEKFREAAQVMQSAPRDAARLVDPDTWWFERRVLSRELLDIGEAKTAYQVAAGHVGGSRTSRADAEFHAGWYALRNLGEAKTAARHFAEIAKIADGPISRARAFYWLGRAAEAGGPGDAKDYYRQAAAYGTAFYGHLAAAKLDRSILDAAHPEPTDLERRRFSGRRSVQAIRRLETAGEDRYAGILYRDLAEDLSNTGELALLAAMAEGSGNHYLALRIGKTAAGRGLEIGMLAHPVGAIPASASVSDAGKALAYAIARQESEFNTGAVSSAGARGLLQLMPGTAKAMARKAGLAYSAPRLTTDAGYNATLGSAYLSEQLGRFDGSYILTFVGYNAGPRRAEDWMERYGDPRGAPLEEVVDWIEHIPFTETRGYVQRVMENYQVYKMRLTGRFDIEQDLVKGR